MPYIGRDLNRGNYLKLDDISSSFNSQTKTFNLKVGGSGFTPGSAFSILVSVGGVIQEPESAYQVNNDTITFANAPTAQDSFFCLALGVPIGIGVPGNSTVNGTQMAKPFNYDGFFYLNDSSNRVGINSSIPTASLDVIGDIKLNGSLVNSGGGGLQGNVYAASGISTFNDVRVTNNLTVEGTTTTLDTNLIGVDRVEVGANSNTLAGIAVTQSGTADLVRLYDGTSQVVTVDDEGRVGIGSAIPAAKLDVSPTIQVKNTALNGVANVDINAANGGQARLNLYAGVSGGVNRAARIDFHNQGVAQWMLINDFSQNGTNQFSIRHDGEHAISCMPDGTVSLYDDGDESLRTDVAGILVPEKVIHLGDTNTYLQFTDDVINLTAGGTTGLSVQAASVRVPTKLGINGAAPQTPLDVIANGSGYAINVRGRSSDNIGEIRFTSNDYGSLYSVLQTGATYLNFQVGSTANAVRIDTNGYVGIKESSPHLYYSPDLVVKAGADAGGITIRSAATTHNNYLMFADGNSGDTRYDGYIKYSHNNRQLQFATATAVRLTIGSNGGVGIGTDHLSSNNSVYHKLMVEGDTTSTIAVTKILRRNSSASNSTYTFEVDSSAHTSNMTSGGAMAVDVYGGRAFTIDGNGKVGIGTALPSEEVVVHGDDPKFEIQEKSASSKVTLGTGTVTGFVHLQKADGTRTVQINGDGDSYFAGGRLLVNRTSTYASSSEKLSVNGMTSIQGSSTSAAPLYVFNTETTADGTVQPFIFLHDGNGIRGGLGLQYSSSNFVLNANNDFQFRTGSSGVGGTEKMRLKSNGCLNIGEFNNTTHLLYLASTGDAGIHIRADSDNSGENDNPYLSMAQDGANTQQFKLGMAGDANTAFNMQIANSPFVHANNGNSQPLQFAHMTDMVATLSSVSTLSATGQSATDPRDFFSDGSLGGNSVGGLKIHHYGNDTAAALMLSGHNNTGTPGQETGTQLTHTGANLRFHIEHHGIEAFNIGPTGNIYLKNCSTIPSFTTSYNVSAISLKGGGLMNYQENNIYLLNNIHYDGAWRNTYTGSGGYITLGSGTLNHYYYADQSSANQSLSLIRNVSFYKNNSAGTGLNQGNRPAAQGQIVIWGHSNATTAGGIEFHSSGGGGAGYGGKITCDTDGSVSINTRSNNSAWTQRLRVGNGSNVTVHNSEFQVDENELQVTSSSSYASHLNYQDNGSHYISIANSGACNFRNSSPGGTLMRIMGTGGIGGGGSTTNIYNPSDERLKENMVELTDGLNKIKRLKPYSFTWKKGFDENLDGITQYGFGAHQAKTVDEKLVEKFIECDIELFDNNGNHKEVIKDPLRVNEKHVLPLLVKAIQEQQEQIETLKAKVAALEGS